jgi:hypothetical protein
MRIMLRGRGRCTEEVEVLRLDERRYELCETPLSQYPLAAMGDIVKLQPIDEDTYKLVRVLERPFLHCDWILPGPYGASQAIYKFGEWISSRGGRWECIMSGLLIVHLPADLSAAEVGTELEARLRTFERSEERKALLMNTPLERLREVAGGHMGRIRIECDLTDDDKA